MYMHETNRFSIRRSGNLFNLPVYETEKLHSNRFDGSVVLSAQVII